MIVADTDILIDALRGREPAAGRIAAAMAEGRLATTTVNAFELRCGVRTEQEGASVENLLAAMPILPLDDPAARAAAACRRELEPKGQTIGLADYLIAGVCLDHAATLLTRNRRHFERIPGLMLDSL